MASKKSKPNTSRLAPIPYKDFVANNPRANRQYMGSDEEWERAEKALIDALGQRGLSYKRMEGEAVFYGPKIDVKLIMI